MALPSDATTRHRKTGEERIEVAKEWKVNVTDAFQLKYVYKMMHDWAIDEGWAQDEFKFPELYYTHRDTPGFGKEIWIRWKFNRKPEGATTDYITYEIDCLWHMLGINPAEIVWRGQKIKGEKGECEVVISSAVIINTKAWEKSIVKGFKDLWFKRMLRKQMLQHKKYVYDQTLKMRALFLEYFKLETFMPESQSGEYHLKRTLE